METECHHIPPSPIENQAHKPGVSLVIRSACHWPEHDQAGPDGLKNDVIYPSDDTEQWALHLSETELMIPQNSMKNMGGGREVCVLLWHIVTSW